MAKKELAKIKLQLPAGQANPSPPVGPALGQHGVNIMEFCTAYNAKTQDKVGLVIPVEITVYADRSFSFITKTPLVISKPRRPRRARLFSIMGNKAPLVRAVGIHNVDS